MLFLLYKAIISLLVPGATPGATPGRSVAGTPLNRQRGGSVGPLRTPARDAIGINETPSVSFINNNNQTNNKIFY